VNVISHQLWCPGVVAHEGALQLMTDARLQVCRQYSCAGSTAVQAVQAAPLWQRGNMMKLGECNC
jgi:hypothetical protein